jgi:hypothetical protein
MKTNQYEKFMRTVIHPNFNLSEIAEVFRDRLFKGPIEGDEEFNDVISVATVNAIAVNLQSQGFTKEKSSSIANKAIKAALSGDQKALDNVSRMGLLVSQDLQRMMEFSLSGEQVFKFSPGLSDRLLHTNIDVPVAMFRMPYKSMIAVHSTEEAIQVGLDCIHSVRPISGKLLKKKPDSLSILMTESIIGGSRVMNISCAIFWGSEMRAFQADLKLGEDPEVSIPEILKEEIDVLQDRAKLESRNLSDAIGNLLNLCVNSALYLVSKEPDIGEEKNEYQIALRKSQAQGLPKKQRDSAKRRLYDLGDITFRDVGQNIAPTRFGVQSPSGDDRQPGTGGKLTKRFLVRGHYKNQAYGPGHSLRRLIFVEPFEKGPDAAELIARTYDVQDDPSREIVTEDDMDLGM